MKWNTISTIKALQIPYGDFTSIAYRFKLPSKQFITFMNKYFCRISLRRNNTTTHISSKFILFFSYFDMHIISRLMNFLLVCWISFENIMDSIRFNFCHWNSKTGDELILTYTLQFYHPFVFSFTTGKESKFCSQFLKGDKAKTT